MFLCVRSLGCIVGASPPVKIYVSVRWVTLWVRPPTCEIMCVRSLGYNVGVSPPPVCLSLRNLSFAVYPKINV